MDLCAILSKQGIFKGGFQVKRNRIWELDALRGICILGMMMIHGVLDVLGFGDTGIWWFDLLRSGGGILFILLSGCCVTLGHHPVRRGLVVFAAGMACTLVTWGLVRLGWFGSGMVIRFGVLHCLGLCMLSWVLFGKLPTWALGLLGAASVALGFWFQGLTTELPWLFPLGIMRPDFSSADYFPIFPHLGYFLLGAVLGRTLYREKRTLFPKVNAQSAPIRALSWCGRQSLFIYLAHQPVLYLVLELVAWARR